MASVRDVKYEAEGTVLRGRLAVPDDDGPLPAVLIAHEANGLDEYQANRAETLAGRGYAAFALDYHGGGQVFTNRDEMMARLEVLGADADAVRALARAGLEGADDPLAPPERVSAFKEELTSSGVDWQMNIYGGVGHSFTHPRAAEMGIPDLK